MENLFVNRVKLNKDNIDNSIYPFNIKCLSNFEEIKIDNSVTLFYGENGVGKSTFYRYVRLFWRSVLYLHYNLFLITK